ncbi:MAG: hypothetical protein J7604_15990 [Sporocytophaga sp.]|uniref:hypothetical protein n=1 Tax=Sporocytophaga sp. TaxID=2231183 RepID=UPI001B0D9C63|nr:hypothetical protein [Sporocytophaga sp.]MBO9701708.1 hypothetical protein [Sporocytophaga sp.]
MKKVLLLMFSIQMVIVPACTVFKKSCATCPSYPKKPKKPKSKKRISYSNQGKDILFI